MIGVQGNATTVARIRGDSSAKNKAGEVLLAGTLDIKAGSVLDANGQRAAGHVHRHAGRALRRRLRQRHQPDRVVARLAGQRHGRAHPLRATERHPKLANAV